MGLTMIFTIPRIVLTRGTHQNRFPTHRTHTMRIKGIIRCRAIATRSYNIIIDSSSTIRISRCRVIGTVVTSHRIRKRSSRNSVWSSSIHFNTIITTGRTTREHYLFTTPAMVTASPSIKDKILASPE